MGKSKYPEEQYKQWREDFRQLNSLFWRTPILASTGIGGLWFGIATLDITTPARTALLSFSVLYCIVMMIIVWRLRMRVMSRLLEWLDEIEGFEGRRSNHVVAVAFMLLMGIACLGSFVAIFNQDNLFPDAETQSDMQMSLDSLEQCTVELQRQESIIEQPTLENELCHSEVRSSEKSSGQDDGI